MTLLMVEGFDHPEITSLIPSTLVAFKIKSAVGSASLIIKASIRSAMLSNLSSIFLSVDLVSQITLASRIR